MGEPAIRLCIGKLSIISRSSEIFRLGCVNWRRSFVNDLPAAKRASGNRFSGATIRGRMCVDRKGSSSRSEQPYNYCLSSQHEITDEKDGALAASTVKLKIAFWNVPLLVFGRYKTLRLSHGFVYF